MTARRNRVVPVLMAWFALAALFGGFLDQAPNRLISGAPIAIWHVVDRPIFFLILAFAGMLIALSQIGPTPNQHRAMLVLATVLLLLVLDGAGTGATRLMRGADPAARVSLGWAFWVMSLAAVFAVIDAAQRLNLSSPLRFVLACAFLVYIAAMTLNGTFDQLSLLREFAAQRGAFFDELARHAELVLGALIPALLIGMPLGIWATRRPRVRPALFGTLNILQTIPSVALFGLMIGPLSALALAVPLLGRLGVHGIGMAPALVALVLYALLPIVRNSAAGIESADPAIIEAARGMGFTPRQIFWRAQLPLGLPVFLAGLRIVLVQTIGLAVIAALIGGGGLGSFIFQGIGQYAIDLVLLGAIPVTLLALAADFLLQLAIASLDSRSRA
jgi:osmoprotectant transport system permease protein